MDHAFDDAGIERQLLKDSPKRRSGPVIWEQWYLQLPEVGIPAIDRLIQQYEEEQKPDLWIDENLANLCPLDGLVQDSCPAEATTGDQQGLLLESEAFGGENAVRKEREQKAAPENSDAAAEEKDRLPHRERRNLADAIRQDAADHGANPVTAVEKSCTERLLLTRVPGFPSIGIQMMLKVKT